MGRFALLVGTNAYADPAYPQLWSPVDDVRRLAAVLRDPDLGGFEVTSCVDRPAADVRYEVARIAAGKRAEDTVLVYISGHGQRDRDGRLYFATTDSEADLISATSCESAFVRDSLERSGAGSRILLLDCCFSASIIAGFTDKSLPDSVLEDHDGRGYVVLTATDRWQPALEQGSRSFFTEAVIEGLHDPDADLDQDGYLSASELYDYVHPRVRTRAGHEPTFFASGVRGTVVVSKAAGGRRRAAAAPTRTRRWPPPAVDGASPEVLYERLRSTFGDLSWRGLLDVLGGMGDVAVGAVTVNPSLLAAACSSAVSARLAAAHARPDDSEALQARAWHALRREWWAESRRDFLAELAANPYHAWSWWGLAYGYVREGAYSAAAQAFAKAARYADLPDNGFSAGSSLLVAAALDLAEEPERAHRVLRDAAVRHPAGIPVAFGLAVREGDPYELSRLLVHNPEFGAHLAAFGEVDPAVARHLAGLVTADVVTLVDWMRVRKGRRDFPYWFDDRWATIGTPREDDLVQFVLAARVGLILHDRLSREAAQWRRRAQELRASADVHALVDPTRTRALVRKMSRRRRAVVELAGLEARIAAFTRLSAELGASRPRRGSPSYLRIGGPVEAVDPVSLAPRRGRRSGAVGVSAGG